MHVNRILYGRSGRPVFFRIFIFPTLVSVLVTLSVFFRHIAFVLLFADFLCGVCFIHNNSQKCVISMIYCSLVFILLSQFYLFFNRCLTFSSFPFWLAQICLLFIFISAFVLFLQRVSFSEFIFLILKICPRIYLFFSPSLVFICLMFCIVSALLLARSGGILPRLFSCLVGQLFPGHVKVDRAALSPSISTFQSIQMGDIKSPRDKL